MNRWFASSHNLLSNNQKPKTNDKLFLWIKGSQHHLSPNCEEKSPPKTRHNFKTSPKLLRRIPKYKKTQSTPSPKLQSSTIFPNLPNQPSESSLSPSVSLPKKGYLLRGFPNHPNQPSKSSNNLSNSSQNLPKSSPTFKPESMKNPTKITKKPFKPPSKPRRDHPLRRNGASGSRSQRLRTGSWKARTKGTWWTWVPGGSGLPFFFFFFFFLGGGGWIFLEFFFFFFKLCFCVFLIFGAFWLLPVEGPPPLRFLFFFWVLRSKKEQIHKQYFFWVTLVLLKNDQILGAWCWL